MTSTDADLISLLHQTDTCSIRFRNERNGGTSTDKRAQKPSGFISWNKIGREQNVAGSHKIC
jgi:hypothetical protein